MWNMLRLEPLRPMHFRRQVPLGPYYADFASHLAKLVIEIDGITHTADGAIAYDQARTAFINTQGYRVIRFTNIEVMNYLEGVFEVVAAAISMSSPTRLGFADPPSPQRGREKVGALPPLDGEG